MKKIFFIAVAFTLLLASCSKKETRIDVVLDNSDLNGTTVYLYEDMFKDVIVDSTVVENTAFSFTLEPNTEKIKMIYLKDKDINLLFIVDKDKLTANLAENRFVNGGELTEKLNTYLSEYESFANNLQELRSDTVRSIEQITEESQQLIEGFMKSRIGLFEADFEKNKDNALATYLLMLYGNYIGEDAFLRYYDLAGNTVKDTDGLKRSYQAYQSVKTTSKGAMFKDAEGVSPTDTTQVLRFSDYIGKGDYVIADFWASWCGPCKREMPFMKEIYEEFGPKGLKLLGVGVFDTLDKHLQVSAELGITWPQIFDLKKDQISGLYGVQSIPTVILFDKDGTIISRDLRGEELRKKVEELYK